MTSDSGSAPGGEVPEADWAEQQVTAEPDPVEGRAPISSRSAHASTAEADTADLADQDFEVLLDDEDS